MRRTSDMLTWRITATLWAEIHLTTFLVAGAIGALLGWGSGEDQPLDGPDTAPAHQQTIG